ncbi:hypothetical protein F5Y05DRAFT_395818 [Hypoxylon sp. FL0543]|nr:hypothetical protein F5Y05DRAFT_395818 [Hypoxylon sp. FL0543]
MDIGLDELIESLLIEIAFSGVRGCSVSALLKAIESFYTDAQTELNDGAGEQCAEGGKLDNANSSSTVSSAESHSQYTTSDYSHSLASKVWTWLVARPDVSVGINRRFNHLSLDEILELPEEEDDLPSAEDTKTPKSQIATSSTEHQRPARGTRELEGATRKFRPRLHVSEERQWKTLTGHGPDLKRVPLFEWKALVDIASTKEKGILQGDLVRLTGQDKRSLPNRTDSLAKKGYIIKQPIILRGCRSSKLWLAKFADSAKQGRDGLNFDKVDLSKETLTKDLAPVPFSSYWNGEKIDYIAIAQAFNAVLKAWGLMRYSDMRIKLDAQRVPQMRAVAKTSRWFTSIGAATFVAARFANGQRLFKDCIKFIREPTAEEWRVFRTTPTAHIKVPSARLGKRGQASRARFSNEVRASPHSQAKQKIRSNSEPSEQEELTPSLWTPYKPMVNTTYEIIKRAGPKGSSNAEICRLTLGQMHRKYVAALTGTLSLPHSQPPHLKRFEVTSQLNRIGKTMTYQFFANDETNSPSIEHQTEDKADGHETTLAAQSFNGKESQQNTVLSGSNYTFSKPLLSQFALTPSSSSPSQLQSVLQVPVAKGLGKRKRGSNGGPTDDTPRMKLGRPPKKARIEKHSSANAQEDLEPTRHQRVPSCENDSAVNSVMDPQLPHTQELPVPSPPAAPPPPRPPGIYREPNNMLDPPGKKGRRKKSLVLTFRFDSLKDQSCLERMRSRHPTNFREPFPPAASLGQSPSPSTLEDRTPISAEVSTAEPKQKRGRRGGKSVYRCDKCGNSWKNPNGLEYHLSKSRSSCNPDYVAPPLPPPKPPRVLKQPPKPKTMPRTESSKIQEAQNQNQDQAPDAQILLDLNRTPSQQKSDTVDRHPLLPSKRIRPSETPVRDRDSEESSGPSSIRRSLILQDVEAYDVINRRRRENSQVAPPNFYRPTTPIRQASQALPRMENGTPDRGREQDAIPDSGMGKGGRMATILEMHQTIPTRSIDTRTEDRRSIQSGFHRFNSKQTGDVNGASAMSSFNLRPSSLEPTMSTNIDTPGTSSISTAADYRTASTVGNLQISKTVNHGPSKATVQLAQVPTPKKPRRSAPTIGAVRRERTALIIEHLLDKNGGVFPGQRSLYLAIVSQWLKSHQDIEPPDWKVCQNVVNRMEKARALQQIHFCFLDDSSKLQECCVLVRNKTGDAGAASLATDPRVVIVKEKMREMFPEPYIPDAFSLPQEEGELFNAVPPRYRDTQRPSEALGHAGKSNVTEDIEVLQYPDHVMGGIPTYATGSKRFVEDDDLADSPPTKRVRADSRNIDKPPSPPKLRKRREPREYWDTGKVAKYIWNRKQKFSEKWSQEIACLQDFTTGAWSASPQAVSSLQPNIDTILSSLGASRENASASMRPGSKAKPEIPLGDSKENHVKTYKPLPRDRSSRSTENEGFNSKLIAATAENPDRSTIVDRFVKPSVSTSFVPDDSVSEDEDDDVVIVDTQHGTPVDDDSNGPFDSLGIRFAETKAIQSVGRGSWPLLSTSSFEVDSSFVLDGTMPDAKWFQRENLPQNAEEIVRACKGKFQFNSWADPKYGKFLREVDSIEKWERSPEGSQILLHGSIAPHYRFISLAPDISRANMYPIALEWPVRNQYTAKNIPDEIKNASPDDDNAGLPDVVHRGRGRPRAEPKTKAQPEPKVTKSLKKVQPAPGSKVEIQYTTRSLNPILIQHRGRVNKPSPDEDKLGLSGETELIAAFVVFKILLGGIDKKVDLGLLLKTFPKFSYSALKKFWPRVKKERKTYIDALTKKFQSVFLEAYEKGDIAPIDYDNLDSYDWKSLIIWATKLETHENVHLPESRQALEKAYSLEDQINEAPDWRETWSQPIASTISRVEATSSEPISLPLSRSVTAEEELISRARSWVRSLCVTPIKGANMPEEIRLKFLKLSGRNESETNKLLKKVVDRLTSERVAARSRGKILGQALRLHGVFAKHLEKAPTVEKFAQAANFKSLLDQTFRRGKDFVLPYVTNDGTIIAIINLQAHGRIRVEAVEIPNIPFGFEPGNYDGRTFPKSYYHFDLRLSPTETYVFDRDLPLLEEALRMEPPQQGPRDEIPIWVDLFGNLDEQRWITYLSITMLGLATKGPLTPQTASVLMKPFVEPFEAKLIMDWVDGLGILQRLESQQSATVGEWWWLVVGKLVVDQRGKVVPQDQGIGAQA